MWPGVVGKSQDEKAITYYGFTLVVPNPVWYELIQVKLHLWLIG